MNGVLEFNNLIELQDEQSERDTWILRLPDSVCQREGFAKGAMISLTFKDGGIKASIIRPPSPKMQEIGENLLKEDRELFKELKRLGD
jgi:hypothetical protein